MTTVTTHDAAADTRWHRWLVEGERQERRRGIWARFVIVALFVGLAGAMLAALAAR
jgi:hypothetical protein